MVPCDRTARDQLAHLEAWASLLAMLHPASFDDTLNRARAAAAAEQAEEDRLAAAALATIRQTGINTLFRES